MTITEEAQSLSPDTRVTLFELDATKLGDNVYHFCADTLADGNSVVFAGTTYTAAPITASGFVWSGKGAPPRPKLFVANGATALQALTQDAGGGVGATLKRIRTFRRFLDDGSTPDPNQIFTLDIFRVNRLSHRSSDGIEWELASAIDQQGRKLPGRVMMRDYCTHIYRRWDPVAGVFDYSKATCPYVGAVGSTDEGPFYDRNGDLAGQPSLDVCSKKFTTGCAVRFKDQQAEGFDQGVMPFRGFPGMGQYK